MTQTEAQAINAGRTQGEWSAGFGGSINIETKNPTSMGDLSASSLLFKPSARLQVGSDGPLQANAKAAAEAVNGTWNKGINPEAVKDVLTFATALLAYYENDAKPNITDWLNLKSALNAAKL